LRVRPGDVPEAVAGCGHEAPVVGVERV
jgi:hypothetical protein